MGPLGLVLALALVTADPHELAHGDQIVHTSTSAPSKRCRDVILKWRRIAKIERAKRLEAERVRDELRAQPPIVRKVEVEVIPAWAWGLIGAGAGIAVLSVAGAVVAVEVGN